MNRKYVLGALILLATITAIIAGITGQYNQNLSANVIGNSKNLTASIATESDFEKCGKFNDVSSSDSFCWLTRIMRDRHIFTGDIYGNFRPNDTVTRAEFTKILVTTLYGLNVNIEDTNSVNGSSLGFNDLQGIHWAYPYIKIAKQRNLIKGYPDGTFKMNNVVTRAEFSKMVYSQLPDIYKKIQEAKAWVLNNWQNPNAYAALEFQPNQWYTDYLMMLIYANTRGIFLQDCVNAGRICPERPVTRLEIAAALQRLTNDYQIPIGYGEGDTIVTDSVTSDNCAKIFKLANITATLQDLGINSHDMIVKCANAYPPNQQTQPQPHPAADNPTGITDGLNASNCLKISRLNNITGTLQSLGISTELPYNCDRNYPAVWQKCATMWNWKKVGGNNGLSQHMSSNIPPFNSEDATFCAHSYGNLWHYEINNEVSSSNCQKIRNLSDITVTLQMLGINQNIQKQCADSYPNIWSPNQQKPNNPDGITDSLNPDNCLKITRLSNMTATLQSLGISTDLMTRCSNTYYNTWHKCVTMFNWKKVGGSNGLSQNMSANVPPFTGEDALSCAYSYGPNWHYEVDAEISSSNCRKIRNLSNITATLQMLGIDQDVQKQCADNYRSIWDNPNA